METLSFRINQVVEYETDAPIAVIVGIKKETKEATLLNELGDILTVSLEKLSLAHFVPEPNTRNMYFKVLRCSNGKYNQMVGSIMKFTEHCRIDDYGIGLILIGINPETKISKRVLLEDVEPFIKHCNISYDFVPDFKYGDECMFVKRSKYTKEKDINTTKDVFVFEGSFNGFAVISKDKAKYYTQIKNLKQV